MFLKQKVQVVMLERSTTKTATTTFHSWEEITKQSKTKAEKNPSLFSNDFSTRITKSEFRPLRFKQVGILCLAKPFDPTLIGFLFDSTFSVVAGEKKLWLCPLQRTVQRHKCYTDDRVSQLMFVGTFLSFAKN